MDFSQLHEWQLGYHEARDVQTAIAGKISRKNELSAPRFVAGIDARYEGSRGMATGAVVVLSYPGLELVEVRIAHSVPLFPYIPGLLSFRECPVIVEACLKVKTEPDLVLVDGQGIAHPRRIGLASHLGLLLDRPTIGCAKSRLVGMNDEPGPDKGAWSNLTEDGELIGAVLRTRAGSRPLYVSIGNKVDLPGAIAWTLNCCMKYRLPEPTRLAHLAASGKLDETGPLPAN
ncbi:MAG: deoxyribonuclease V [Chloroflexi bacterium]|nr:deoxyribonuclease V [Chloroflexota bacterium]